MGDLFWNKVAGAVLAILLIVMGLREVGDIIFDASAPETLGFPVDPSVLEGPGGAAEEASGPVDFGLLLATASTDAGERVARRCVACHTFDQGGANGTGPNMWGVLGRAVASVAGFNYSSAMRDYGSDGTQWLYQNMYDYLEAPRRYVPGTSMAFAGLRSQEDRINLIAYMHSMGSSQLPFPDPLPEEPAITEDVDPASVAASDAMPAPDTATESVEDLGEMAQPAETPADDETEEPQDADE